MPKILGGLVHLSSLTLTGICPFLFKHLYVCGLHACMNTDSHVGEWACVFTCVDTEGYCCDLSLDHSFNCVSWISVSRQNPWLPTWLVSLACLLWESCLYLPKLKLQKQPNSFGIYLDPGDASSVSFLAEKAFWTAEPSSRPLTVTFSDRHMI